MNATTPRRPRRRLLLLVAAGAVMCGVAVWGGLSIWSGAGTTDTVAASTAPDDDATPSATPSPLTIVSPTPAPIGSDAPEELARASAAAEQIIASSNEIAQRGDGGTVGIASIATGFVQGEIEARAKEQADLGYRQVGEATVTQITEIGSDLTASPPTVTLAVCVDTSGIDVLDAAGASMKQALYDPGRPVKHVYGAQFLDDVWKIATHDIPDDQDCPTL